MPTTLVAAACLLLWVLPAAAVTYTVNPEGTGDFPSIYHAINGAENGDVIELVPGTYTGGGNRDITFLGKTVTVRSQTGNPADCIIDCQGSSGEPHRGFTIESGQGPNAVIEGLTIINGYGPGTPYSKAGALFIQNSSSPTIRNCVFENNHVTMAWNHIGGAVYVDSYCDGLFENCVFRDNSGYFGGAVAVNHSSRCEFYDCSFYDNTGGRGGGVWGNCTAKIRCVFAGNTAIQGGAVWGNGYNVDLSENCTYWNNSASEAGGAIYAQPGYGDPVRLIDTIVAGCTAGAGLAVFGEVPVEISCSDLYGNEGGDWIAPYAEQVDVAGNFSADPCFCDPDGEDFHLCADSWCLPGHHPWGCDQLTGTFGQGCGECSCAGEVALEATSWGGLKSLYR